MGNSNTEVSEEEDECNFPSWHTKLGDNWPLAGVPDVKTTPKFVMSIKKMKDGETSFKPGKRYKIVLKSGKGKKTPKINGVYFTVEGSDASCSRGMFAIGGKNQKKAAATDQCKTMALLNDQTGQALRKTTVVWKAPKDVNDGCSVTIRATILGSDNKLYYDGEDEEENQQYQRLTMNLTKK